jgi:hypothetical protein
MGWGEMGEIMRPAVGGGEACPADRRGGGCRGGGGGRGKRQGEFGRLRAISYFYTNRGRKYAVPCQG